MRLSPCGMEQVAASSGISFAHNPARRLPGQVHNLNQSEPLSKLGVWYSNTIGLASLRSSS